MGASLALEEAALDDALADEADALAETDADALADWPAEAETDACITKISLVKITKASCMHVQMRRTQRLTRRPTPRPRMRTRTEMRTMLM